MRIGVLMLNFGEPERYDHESVVAFLERIFLVNAPLMGSATPEEVRRGAGSWRRIARPG
jgi:protoporphyrin/coproporphyrin ferrochelatase